MVPDLGPFSGGSFSCPVATVVTLLVWYGRRSFASPSVILWAIVLAEEQTKVVEIYNCIAVVPFGPVDFLFSMHWYQNFIADTGENEQFFCEFVF